MIMSRDQNIVRIGNIKIGDLSFEEVEKFKYLGATVTNVNDTREEIKRRINMGNACYYSVENLLSSSLLSKNLKVRIYKTVILPVVLYGCETWTLTLREEHRLRVFENKVLRKIFGAKRDEVIGEWRKLHNTELHALYSSPDIIRNIKSRRLRWAGHVPRMGESRNAYRVQPETASLAAYVISFGSSKLSILHCTYKKPQPGNLSQPGIEPGPPGYAARHSSRYFTGVDRCLRRILQIRWPDIITNSELWKITNQEEITIEIKRRKWNWIGHTIRKEDGAVERMALDWNLQGSRTRGKPKNTWKRTVLEEIAREGKTWSEVKKLATNRQVNKYEHRVLVGKPEGKWPLGKTRRRLQDNVKMGLREVGYDGRDWINFVQDRDQWRAYVRTALNVLVL
ncbi:hypothetical protein ANN_21669 [Periplaneta americana]|uniref:Endonuclease-reverse transcriptase n=1 Tax=Periplaneta americana TaxID=6978 RepID=A0ABQ8S6L0_PERAM|nr:hypothetical protein ANN_21669 [Periplaneta americana]